mmetsp:Transcript_20112/g.46245  ORF Transcript_20112/g.46245 Transcript_20112/m.46245 type:complete len:236 (+) Transcript_20112:257-964(+)
MQTRVTAGIDCEGIRPVVQQHLHHCDSVCANSIPQRSDALLVLNVQWLFPGNALLDSLEIAHLGGLVEAEGRSFDLLQSTLHLCGQSSHLLTDFHHKLLVRGVLQGSCHAILLDVFQDRCELWVLAHCLHLLLHFSILLLELLGVVLGECLSLQPPSHRIGVLCELLQVLCHLGVAFKVSLHLRPCGLIHVGHTRNRHGRAIIERQGLAHRHCGCCSHDEATGRSTRAMKCPDQA